MAQSYAFPRNFVWGVATAAAQIEGAAQEETVILILHVAQNSSRRDVLTI